MKLRTPFSLCVACSLLGPVGNAVLAADDLQLRPGISFNQDIDNGFPIVGNHLADTTIADGLPTLIFFGASGDFNTNRQAKRFVEIYRKEGNASVKFIVIDVDRPGNEQAKNLVKSYYKGYIPHEILLDKSGKVAWAEVGEVNTATIKRELDKVR